ncbi:cold-shock protein (plasmid) [Agrobacterium fabrum]|uniref:Cold-shock protein n=1 Tax=Agrobacterium fabrum (strain C58 / ATCC 33970) TaxID=176299 RepID=Q8U5Q9_AGRFC|nr:hypothetical protein Atu8053 [Agrobacterium fabrum str. C58]QRM62490.1 cold-shock protein [Agrobacterium fabrum]QRM62780.1 cold-shock protein [Agrobacterium fabrum]TRB28249.1 cold-shock protein [Agrobacterium fabrum]
MPPQGYERCGATGPVKACIMAAGFSQPENGNKDTLVHISAVECAEMCELLGDRRNCNLQSA